MAKRSERAGGGRCSVVAQVDVSFGHSRSSYLPSALRIAKQFPTFGSKSVDGAPVYSVSIPITFTDQPETFLSKDTRKTWEQLCKLCNHVRFWKHGEVVITGDVYKTFDWLEKNVAHVDECYRVRQRRKDREGYCSGKDSPAADKSMFGCRRIKGVNRSTGYGPHHNAYLAEWYEFGTLSNDCSEFVVGKDAILQRIQEDTGDSLCTACPAFNWDRVKRDIDDPPNVINLGKTSRFVLRYSEVDREHPIGIVPEDMQQGGSFSVELGPEEEDEEEGTNENREAEEQTCVRNVPNVRYSDVAAQERAISEIQNTVQLPLTHPEYFEELGVEAHRGVLLYGPPGNGKTLIAKAVATESNAHLEIINGPEILSKWVGGSERNLRRIFERARKLAPAVVLVDEIDAIAPKRTEMSFQHEISVVSQLLVLLDGLEERGRVVVIATTNRIEAVDSAVTRPGRFDYHIEVSLPDQNGRCAILKTLMSKLKVEAGVDCAALAEETGGFSGAELAAVCREAGLATVLRGIKEGTPAKAVAISGRDFDSAVKSIIAKRHVDGQG